MADPPRDQGGDVDNRRRPDAFRGHKNRQRAYRSSTSGQAQAVAAYNLRTSADPHVHGHWAPPAVSGRRAGPALARLLRAPARLYDWHAGWLLGRRFLCLTHVGRRSGHRYQTVLEVVGENRDRHEVIVVAGLGRSAQWYRNVLAGNATEVAIGRERFVPTIVSCLRPRRPPSLPTTNAATGSSLRW